MNTSKTLLLTGLLACAAPAAHAAYSDVVGTDNPVGYWRLGDAPGSVTAHNSGSLSGADGIIINGSSSVNFGVPGALSGDTNTAISLSGDGSKIEVPYKAELNPSVFTIEVWAQASPDGTYRSPVCSRAVAPERGYFFYKDFADTWQFWSGTGFNFSIMGGPAAEAGAWAHLVGIFDGTNKWFYVNGVLVAAEQSPFVPNTERVFRIGGGATEDNNGNFFFNGGIDEVALYNKALSADRVVAHYSSGAGSAPANVAPALARQPGPSTNSAHTSLTLLALATGTPPLSYQWSKDGSPMPGATSYSLVLNDLQVSNSGLYTITVTNRTGSVTGTNGQITVVDAVTPVITQQPQSVQVFPGNLARFSVTASGSSSFTYQWKFNGSDLSGANASSLTITSVQATNLGTYRVLVTDPAGSTLSDPATLAYPPAPTKTYAATVKDDAPVGYWRLGDTQDTGIAKDEVGTDDGSCTSVSMGQPGALANDSDTAAGFAGGSKVDVGYNPDLNPTNFTIECWAKVTGGAGNHRAAVSARSTNPDVGGPEGFIIYAEPGNTWQFWAGTSNNYGWDVVSGPSVHQNAYDYLVGTYDGTNLSLYVNSVLVGQHQPPAGSVRPNSMNPFRIGAGENEDFGNFWFDGSVDEVAIYAKALTQNQILAHYVAGFPMTTPPTVTLNPSSQTVPPGASVTFTVAASGIQPLSYQWRFNGNGLANATQTALTLNNISTLNVGGYDVVITNIGGSTTSLVANLAIPSAPTSPYDQVVENDGPAGYWRLGETSGTIAKDEMGSHDGTYLGGVTLGVVGAIPKNTNTAASFNGNGQKVDVPYSDALNPAVFTVECWAKVTGGAGSHRSPLTSRSGTSQGYIFYAEPGNTWQFWLSPAWTVLNGPAVRTNAYDHLVGVYDGTNAYFYVNGLLKDQRPVNFTQNLSGSVLRIGGGESEDDGNFFFVGSVDEVAVYGKALSNDQIVQHYMAGYVAPVILRYTWSAGSLSLSWDSGTLQSATTLNGSWSNVTSAASPYPVNRAGSNTKFFRLKIQ